MSEGLISPAAQDLAKSDPAPIMSTQSAQGMANHTLSLQNEDKGIQISTILLPS
jgi:hypothetical protein